MKRHYSDPVKGSESDSLIDDPAFSLIGSGCTRARRQERCPDTEAHLIKPNVACAVRTLTMAMAHEHLSVYYVGRPITKARLRIHIRISLSNYIDSGVMPHDRRHTIFSFRSPNPRPSRAHPLSRVFHIPLRSLIARQISCEIFTSRLSSKWSTPSSKRMRTGKI